MANFSLVKTANSAKGTLAGGISANQGTLSLLGGEGGRFPALNANEYFYITVTSSANESSVSGPAFFPTQENKLVSCAVVPSCPSMAGYF